MGVTRRRFVTVGTAAVAGLSLTGSLAEAFQKGETPDLFTVSLKTMYDEKFRLSMALFDDQVNTTFSARNEAGESASLTLVRAENLATPSEQRVAASWEERFSLIFHASATCPLRQGLHEVQHLALGDFPLFIVPMLSASVKRRAYEATFNRIVPAERSA